MEIFMNGIINMLLGIAIMLAVIVFHLSCVNDGLWTDFIAIIGLIFVIKGYNTKDTDNESTK